MKEPEYIGYNVVKNLVARLYKKLLDTYDNYYEGDNITDDLESLKEIISKFPVDIEMPDWYQQNDVVDE